MAKKMINGSNGPVENVKRCSFSEFFVRVGKVCRHFEDGIPFEYKGKVSFYIIRTYFDPYSGMPMFGCEKDNSIFSVSASEVYNDESHLQLLSLYDSIFPVKVE